MVEMAMRKREGRWRGGAVVVLAETGVLAAAVAVATMVASPLAAQEPVARAYLEPPEVEAGERFALHIEISGVTEVEALTLPERFPFALAATDPAGRDATGLLPPVVGDVMPYTLQVTPATGQSPGSVTVSYALVAEETGFLEFDPFRIAADGRTLQTEAVMLFVRPRSEPTTARAWIEPPVVRLMEPFTLFVDVPGPVRAGRVDVPDLSEFATRQGMAGALSSRRPASYQYVALRSGTHEIGPLTVHVAGEVYETEPVTLVVSDEPRGIEAHAGVNTERAWVGGQFVLVVEATGAREFDQDPVLPDLSSFAELLAGASMGRTPTTVDRTYRFRALVPGDFEIGPITVRAAGQTVRTEPIRLTIAEAPPVPVAVPEDLRTSVAVHKRRVYVGEPVPISYQLLARSGLGREEWSVREGTTFTPPVHEDLRLHDLGRQSGGWRRVSVDDRLYRAHSEHVVAFVPLETGGTTIGPAVFQVQVSRPADLPLRTEMRDPTRARLVGWMGEWTPMTLTTDPIAVEVMPLPTEGRPQSFRGRVGRVEIASRLNRTEAQVGDTVTLRVEVTGGAYLRLMPDPAIIVPDGFDILGPEISDDPPRIDVDQPGQRTLVFRLVPKREGSYRIPAVELAWFDPETEEYGVSRAEPFDITVDPGGGE